MLKWANMSFEIGYMSILNAHIAREMQGFSHGSRQPVAFLRLLTRPAPRDFCAARNILSDERLLDRGCLFSVKHSATSCTQNQHPNMTAFMTGEPDDRGRRDRVRRQPEVIPQPLLITSLPSGKASVSAAVSRQKTYD